MNQSERNDSQPAVRDRPKAIVVGLDGTRLETLEYLSRQGTMPNVRRILAEGASGLLRSVLPPYSAPAWVTMATGVNPGKHGVFDFYLRDPKMGGRIPVNATNIAARTMWQILGDSGHEVAVINVPITYPPRPVNGVIVSDFLVTPEGQSRYTYPDDLQNRIERIVPGFHPAPFKSPSRTLSFVEEVIDWTDKAERVCQLIIQDRPWIFFMNVFQATDVIQHYFFDYLQPEKLAESDDPIVAALLRLYRRLDEIVGTRLEMMDDQTTLCLVSDHGFTTLRRTFYLNRWLQDNGWLSMRRPRAYQRLLGRLGLSQRRVVRWLKRADLLGLLDRMSLDARRQMGARLDLAMGGQIDWERTVGYAGPVSSQAVYVNAEAIAQRSGTAVIDDLIADLSRKLSEVRDPVTGSPILQAVFRREEIYTGRHAECAPHVIFEPTPGYMVDNKVSVQSTCDDVLPTAGTGLHHRDGFFALYGRSIKPSSEQVSLLQVQITDIAPTLLYLLGEPVPATMDGRVVAQVLDPVTLTERPVEYAETSHLLADEREDVYSVEDMEVIHERLRDLGYLG